MPHAIVQTTDARGNAELYIIPEGWIQETSRGKTYHLWPKYKNKRHLQQMVNDGNCTGNPNWEKIKCIVKKKNIGTIEDAEQLVTAMSDENNSDFSITSAPTLDGIQRANFENLMVIDDVKNESTEAIEENRWSEYSIEWLHDNDAHDAVESINGSVASLHSTHGNETKVAVEENQSAKYSTEEWLHENDANDKCDTTNDSVATVCSNHGYQMLADMDDANAQYPHSYIPCDPNNLVKSNHLPIDENNNVPRHTQNRKGDYDHTQQLNEIDNRLSRIEKMQATLITQMNILLDKTCPRVPPHLKEKHANIKTIKTLEDLEKLNKDLESFTNMRTIFDWLDFLISDQISHNRLIQALDILFDKTFLTKCSWTGVGRTGSKIQFQSYQNVVNLFKEIGSTNDEQLSLNAVANFFKDTLKYAQKRLNNKGLRKSTKHTFKHHEM